MEKIYVAKLGKAVGLKGQLRLFIESDFPEQFKINSTFTTNKKKELTIETLNGAKDLVKFVGIDSVEEAKKLTNSLLFTSAQESKENIQLEKNQYFWFDIIDCFIYEDSILLGTVKDIQRMPIDDYLLIETSKELLEKYDSKVTSFMIPYNDSFIKSVDIDKKTIESIGGIDIFEAS